MCSLKDSQNSSKQFFMVLLLNQDVVDIEKPNGIHLLTFVVDESSGLFLHPSIFSIIHSRSAEIINGALSNFLFWLNSNL